ncbi:PRC-barrel domain-containing protein [Xanthobacter dioxanivorans]|uniref:PRC-barrel domain-containing protein n=1 Tax=Xanthobacter dioxanivorans TaxID=2528964 RepID=A0A974SH57_9HYPH|nr:PRC-barrel domain-containing protein [Xanthobacter dioxanivorans]QRG05936.1 PRC-barrel domain-containing protein [Xanthobacter dioxanivorans]
MLIQAKSTDRHVHAACILKAGARPVPVRLSIRLALRACVAVWLGRLAGGFAALATVTGIAMSQPAPLPPVQPPAQPQPAAPAQDPSPPAGPAQRGTAQGTPSQGAAGQGGPGAQPGTPATARLPGTETPAVILDGTVADTLLGKPVKGLNGEDMGRLVDVMVDRSGVIRAAIVDFGGFLGVGTRKIAVDWRVLHFSRGASADTISVDLSRDQLRTAPAYKPGEAVVIVGRADPAAPAPSAAPAAAADAAASSVQSAPVQSAPFQAPASSASSPPVAPVPAAVDTSAPAAQRP